MKKLSDIIKRPRLTEKAYAGVSQQRYVFDVDLHAGKDDIRLAIEKLFGVTVVSVRTVHLRPKKKIRGVRSRHKVNVGEVKKAYVSIKEGQHITVFDDILTSEEA